MRQKVGIVLLLGFLLCVPLVAAAGGNLRLLPSASWAKPLSDTELDGMRGGIGGLAFSVFFTGFVDRLGNVEGQLINGVPASPPNINVAPNGDVMVQTVIGGFAGATGIFQIAQVPGDFNIVHNNLFIQINLGVAERLAVPDLSTLFRSLP
jgi:hypothetical protein